MAKYIHISQLGNSKRLCGGFSYSINHAFTRTATCPRCLEIAAKYPELTHYNQPFKDREDLLGYMEDLKHNKALQRTSDRAAFPDKS